jgi:hypothetical protein
MNFPESSGPPRVVPVEIGMADVDAELTSLFERLDELGVEIDETLEAAIVRAFGLGTRRAIAAIGAALIAAGINVNMPLVEERLREL